MHSLPRRFVVVALVILIVSAAFLAAIPRASAAPAAEIAPPVRWQSPEVPAQPAVDPDLMRFVNAPFAAPAYWDKMSASVQDAALSGDGSLGVAILTDDVTALGARLRSLGVDTPVGSVPAAKGPLRVVAVELPNRLLEKVAALDAVLTMAPSVQPVAPDRMDPEEPAVSASGAPTIAEAGKGHGVPQAWGLGYRGYGVQVATMDSGTDFGHPDLQGTFARVNDPSSPYDGWPIAFDPTSMWFYLMAGQRFPQTLGSWYVDTNFATSADPVTGLTTIPYQGRVYNVSGVPSASGWYRMGIHPDMSLRSWWYGENVAVLVTDASVPFVYDTVYVDLDDNYAFGNDKPATQASPEVWMDNFNATSGAWDNSTWNAGDGFADISGGMIYFIADGANDVPYADVLRSNYGLPAGTPPNEGTLVAFMICDALAAGGDHGTLVASSIVAQNRTGMVLGFAPDARIISVGNVYASFENDFPNGFFYDIYSFAGQGYDGVPGTGDEAQIASSSYGNSERFNDGWDFHSRWVELNSFMFSNTAYVVSSGNGGHGFGTVTEPAGSNGVITVGASTSYNAALGSFETAAHSTFGDVQPWSNRGPSMQGRTKPDVVTVGAWAWGDGTLNEFGFGAFPGYTWGGTSLSAPATAGVLALIYQAWTNTTGVLPNNFMAKWILTDSARNIHYDPLVAGHGLTDAYRAILLSTFREGILAFDNTTGFLPVPEWAPGDYRGTPYASFARLMYPGQNATKTFTVYNANYSSPQNVTVYDWQLEKIRSDTWTVAATNAAESAGSMTRPDYLYNLTGSVPGGTALVQVTVSFPLAQFDPNGDYNYDSRWRVLLYDWLDYNGNGSYWNDLNGNGVVNSGEMDQTAGMEIMRFTYGYPSGTNIQATVHDPMARIHDGLLLGIQHRTRSAAVPATTLTVTVDYYAAVDAPWLSEDVASAMIPAGLGNIPVNLTVDVPANAPLGVLSGVVSIANTTWGETQIPVIVNVAANTTSFTFGGNASATAYHDNNRVAGGNDWTWRAEAGDWRHFFVDIPDATPIPAGSNLLVHTTWQTAPTDIDTLVLGPTADLFSTIAPWAWGPYTLDLVGQSPSTYMGSGKWRFQTATGGPEEWVAAPLSRGLHEIALHNVLYAGNGPSEVFSGEVGTMSLTPSSWNVVTEDPTGSESFNLSASLDLSGLEVRAYGLGQPTFDGSLPIAQGGNYQAMFSASSIGVIDVATSGPGGMDIDLYLYRWTGTGWELRGASTSPVATERVRLVTPPDGTYLIYVDGYSIPGGSGTFGLYRAVVAGTDLTPRDVPPGAIPGGTPVTFNVSFDTGAKLAGVYLGILFVGPAGAPILEVPATFTLVDAKTPTILSTDPAPGETIPTKAPTITVSYEDPAISSGLTVAFVIDGLPLTFGSWNATEFRWSFPFDLTEGLHTANFTVLDGVGRWDSIQWTFTVDTTAPVVSLTEPSAALTAVSPVFVAGSADAAWTLSVNGVPTLAGPPGAIGNWVDLTEGPNTILLIATDAAGNSASTSRSITLDTTPPDLIVFLPNDGDLFATSLVYVEGNAEVGSEVSVNGVRVVVDSAGDWYVYLPFGDGLQILETTATDAAGNQAMDIRTITVDTTAPVVALYEPTETLTSDASVLVTGYADETWTLSVNGVPFATGPAGDIGLLVDLVEGPNDLELEATDLAGNTATVSKEITLDTAAPSLAVTEPADASISPTSLVHVAGTAEVGADVSVNGVRVVVDGAGDWAVDLVFADGVQTITTSARDAAGNDALDVRTVTVDTAAPALSVSSPTAGLTANPSATVSGTTEAGVTLTVNGSAVTVGPGGVFSLAVTLVEGANVFTVVATDAAGHSSTVVRTVVLDTTAPTITMLASLPPLTNLPTVFVFGSVDDLTVSVTVNGGVVTVNPNGSFLAYAALTEGANLITVVARDAAGNFDAFDATVLLDTTAPSIALTSPTSLTSNRSAVVVAGFVTDPTAFVFVNGQAVTVGPTGSFSVTLTLADGLRPITVVASDLAGNTASVATAVLVDTTAPVVTVDAPAQGTETEEPSVVVRGIVDDPTATVVVNGQQVRPASDGSWRTTVALSEGSNAVVVYGVDSLGNRGSEASRSVTYASPIPGLDQGLADNNQAISALGNNLLYGLVGVIVILAAALAAVYLLLSRKIAGSGAKTPEAPPPEDKGEL